VIVKRYVGDNAEGALRQAKTELGEDAIILSSGPTRDVWWRFWQRRYQVLVAADMKDRGAPTEARPRPVAPRREARREPTPVDAAPWSEMVGLLQSLDRRLKRLEDVEGESPAVSGHGAAEALLMTAGVSEAMAVRLAEGLPRQDWRDPLRTRILERLGAPKPISLREPIVVTAVGPTGSGKTTTLAKLAAHFALVQKRKVLLVTTDTYRVAAAEQLRTFAAILSVPLEVALRPQEVEGLVEKSTHDVILIDTAGRSPFHELHLAEIHSVARAAGTRGVSEVLAVLPATMRSEEMVLAARRFAPDGAKICFTKLDEAERPGAMIETALHLGWPLAYMTDGQSVPEDIDAADPARLVNWVFDPDPVGGGEHRG
jgi:flagellar biosynthesis protein FlhF